MAAAVYSTDLIDISTAESSTGWAETSASGWNNGANPILEPDFFIQGSNCVAKYMTNLPVGQGGVVYNNGSSITFATDACFFAWVNQQCPNNIDVKSAGGLSMLIGSSTANFNVWYLAGKDTYTYGGWLNLVVDPTLTPDNTLGTPTNNQYLGIGVKQIAAAKGGTGVDVMRYGRGELKCLNGDVGNGYATFAGASAKNDANDATDGYNRWGLCQAISGGYLQKGLFLMGDATTAVDFRDSNKSVLIDNTEKVTSTFNLFEIRNASSRVDWSSISFQALGTAARGNFTVTDNATVNWDGCTFTDVGLFSLLSNTTVTGSVFRRTDKITTGGATLTNCVIDKNRATTAVLVSSPANATLISGCEFVSDGTGHGLEVTGTAANFTVSSTFSGYASSNGSTGNEAIFVNIATGSVEISYTGGGSQPSIRTAGATVTFAATSVTVSVTVVDAVTGDPVPSARVLIEKVSDGTDILTGSTNASGVISGSFSYTADVPVIGRVRRASSDLGDGTLYKAADIPGTINSAGFSVTVSLQRD